MGRRLASVALLVAALVLVSLPATAGAATADEWRREADAICRDGNTVIGVSLSAAFPNGLSPDPTPDDLKLLAATAAPIFQAQHDLIAELERPAKLKKRIKRLLKTFQAGVDTIAEGATTAAIGAEAIDDALVPAAKLARKLGLKVCGA